MKKKTHKLTIEFDNKESADMFLAHWLDGGGDGGGNLDWNTTKWNKTSTTMRVKGTGYCIEDGEIMTPEREQQIWENMIAKLKSMRKC